MKYERTYDTDTLLVMDCYDVMYASCVLAGKLKCRLESLAHLINGKSDLLSWTCGKGLLNCKKNI